MLRGNEMPANEHVCLVPAADSFEVAALAVHAFKQREQVNVARQFVQSRTC